ncbi:MAG: GDSL-type esterase/lipase family protein [Planctomycetota bacterium]|nr:GDSL-type esterase/lipase family protein [Planctomycetota bacterium]
MKPSFFAAVVLLVAFPVSGRVSGGDSVADAATRGLPKIVLVGDSIRLSYAALATKELEGKAIVVSPQANGGDSENVVKNLDMWVIRENPTVVHFNCGIHDTKRFLATGRFQVPPEQYEANLRKIVNRIRQETGAVVIFATTTPVLDDRAAKTRQGRDYELLGASIEQYNAIARKVMKELKVPINDLHKALSSPAAPHTTENLIGSDGVHLTTPARELLSKQVAAFVCQHLPVRPQE